MLNDPLTVSLAPASDSVRPGATDRARWVVRLLAVSPEIRRRRRGRTIRQVKRFLRAHPRLMFGCGVLAVGLLATLWVVWRAMGLAEDLDRVARESEIMRAALVRGDATSARAALDRYQESAEAAESKSGGPTWWVVEKVPFVGDDAEGIEKVSAVLADLGRDGLPPVIDAADQVTAEAFRPENHTFPLKRVAALEEPARLSEAAFDDAAETLGDVDTSGFSGAIRLRFETLQDLVDSARSALGSTYRAARLMPSLLGEGRPHHYLMVLQNNAELRSTGGLPGSVSLVRASGGEVRIVEQEDMAALGATADPIIPLDAEERAVFGTVLGRTGVDATLTPDTPRAAELIRARWQSVKGGRIDGVFFVDPVAVSYLLNGTGPVALAGYPSIDATNVVAAVENTIYLTSPDRQVHSDYQNAVAKGVFDAFVDGTGNSVDVLRGLELAVREGRIRVHSFNVADQEEIADTAIAGEFADRPTEHPEVGVYVNDSTESKMSYYLKYDAALSTRSCTGGVQTMAVTMSFTNASPDVATLPPSVTGVDDPERDIVRGQQFVVVYVTSPIGGRLLELSYDGQGPGATQGERVEPAVQTFRGREVATVGIRLDRGQTQTLRLVARSGLRQDGDPRLTVTPSAQIGTESEEIPSAC